MIRFAMLTGLAAAAALSAGAAEPDPMAGYYGARLQIDLSSGGDYHGIRVFSRDHTYRDTFRDEGVEGTAVGKWTLEDGKLCTLAAGAGAMKYCNLGLGKKVGDSWQDSDPYTGNPVRFSLQPGGSELQVSGGERR
jgi:hypothetical protein